MNLNSADIVKIWKSLSEIEKGLQKVLSGSSITYHNLAEEKSREVKLEEQISQILEVEKQITEEEMSELQEEIKLIAWVRNLILKTKSIEEAVNYFINTRRLHQSGK